VRLSEYASGWLLSATAPKVHRYGWGPKEYDKLPGGTIADHIIECGAQCAGGNCQHSFGIRNEADPGTSKQTTDNSVYVAGALIVSR
jgi:hypothetical protein